MAGIHAAGLGRLVKNSLHHYVRNQITSAGLTTGARPVRLRDAFPDLTTASTLDWPAIIIEDGAVGLGPWQVGGGTGYLFSYVVTVLGGGKNQRDDLAWQVTDWMQDARIDLIDWNVSPSTVLGAIETERVAITAPIIPVVGSLPTLYENARMVLCSLRVYQD